MSYEECLKRMEARIPDYIKSVGEFQYKNEKYTVTNFYIADTHQQCQICGHFPIREVYVVTNTEGENFRVGNKCIDTITNKKIARWYKTYRRRRDNLDRNKQFLKNPNLPEKLRTKICEGFNLTKKQKLKYGV